MLVIRVCKIINGHTSPTIDNFFRFRENTHNLRNFQIILNKNKKTVRYGSETISYRIRLLWAHLQEKIQTCKFFEWIQIKNKKLKMWYICLWVMPTFPLEFRFYLKYPSETYTAKMGGFFCIFCSTVFTFLGWGFPVIGADA